MKKKETSISSGSAVRPHRWLRESSPEEIAIALTTIDPEKAVAVVVCLTTRSGREMASRIDRAIEEAHREPGQAALRVGRAVLRSLLSP